MTERELLEFIKKSPVIREQMDKIVRIVEEKLMEAYKRGYADGLARTSETDVATHD